MNTAAVLYLPGRVLGRLLWRIGLRSQVDWGLDMMFALTDSMGDAIRPAVDNRNKLKQHFRVLVERRHLAQHGVSRGAWYALASSSDMPHGSQHEEQADK